MKTIKFTIPIFDVDVRLMQVEEGKDKEQALSILRQNNATEEILQEVEGEIDRKSTDGGVAFWNKGTHTAVIVFYPMTDRNTMLKCYSHEKRHLEDRVLECCGINDRETAGYLAGHLEQYFVELAEIKE